METETETITQHEAIFQTLRPITTEFIIFAGGTAIYNGGPSFGPPLETPNPGGSLLTVQQEETNDNILLYIARLLRDNEAYWVNLHGHANPIAFDDGERDELMALSLTRATAVHEKLKGLFIVESGLDLTGCIFPLMTCTCPACRNFEKRARSSGYGGEHLQMTNVGPNTFLNRRVEVIIFAINTERN